MASAKQNSRNGSKRRNKKLTLMEYFRGLVGTGRLNPKDPDLSLISDEALTFLLVIEDEDVPPYYSSGFLEVCLYLADEAGFRAKRCTDILPVMQTFSFMCELEQAKREGKADYIRPNNWLNPSDGSFQISNQPGRWGTVLGIR